jgi:hypothetical protein
MEEIVKNPRLVLERCTEKKVVIALSLEDAHVLIKESSYQPNDQNRCYLIITIPPPVYLYVEWDGAFVNEQSKNVA